MLMCRELGVDVRPALSRNDLKDPDRRLQAATAALAGHRHAHRTLRVPNAAAPIEITADLRASRVRCSMTVDAPTSGRVHDPAELAAAPAARQQTRRLHRGDQPCASAATERSARSPSCARRPSSASTTRPGRSVPSPSRYRPTPAPSAARAAAPSSPPSWTALDTFYADVAQHIKPWTPPPVKVRDDEPPITDTQHTPETDNPVHGRRSLNSQAGPQGVPLRTDGRVSAGASHKPLTDWLYNAGPSRPHQTRDRP